MIDTFDDVLVDPQAYRASTLRLPFQSIELSCITFHGIALPYDHSFRKWLESQGLTPSLSFVRKSPAGQLEPHFVHSDADMGDWTAILYLNDPPMDGDGTSFWQSPTGAIRGAGVPPFERDAWQAWQHVTARFNRCVVFDSTLYHSRAMPQNYGDGDTARLIQVAFGQFQGASRWL